MLQCSKPIHILHIIFQSINFRRLEKKPNIVLESQNIERLPNPRHIHIRFPDIRMFIDRIVNIAARDMEIRRL